MLSLSLLDLQDVWNANIRTCSLNGRMTWSQRMQEAPIWFNRTYSDMPLDMKANSKFPCCKAARYAPGGATVRQTGYGKCQSQFDPMPKCVDYEQLFRFFLRHQPSRQACHFISRNLLIIKGNYIFFLYKRGNLILYTCPAGLLLCSKHPT